jgi:CheY-like chemotaxis protein
MPHELAKARVLVVDDHYSNRLALETLLESEYAVDTAGSGQSALKLASNHAYAVILLDVRMPEMDGFETAALLRENPKVHDTAIIFTSAYDQSDAKVAKGFQAGATDYLLSPFDTDFLKLKMRTYVRMFLRIQALRIHIERITNILQSLQLEVSRSGNVEEALRTQVSELEEVVREMRREIVPA